MTRARSSNELDGLNGLLRRALDGLAVGLVFVSPGGKVIWLNPAAAEMLGATPAELTGRAIEHVFLDPLLSAFWQDAQRAGDHHFGHISVRWPRQMELRVNATHYRDENGGDVGRALLLCDVTKERQVQVELSQAVATRLLALTSGHMPPEPVANLTTQELRILRLVGRGVGNEEIAAATHISASTVRSHLKSLYRKLNLTSRAEAVSFAVRHHLV